MDSDSFDETITAADVLRNLEQVRKLNICTYIIKYMWINIFVRNFASFKVCEALIQIVAICLYALSCLPNKIKSNNAISCYT